MGFADRFFFGQMPLPDVAGRVAGVAEMMRECLRIGGQRNAVAPAAGFRRIESRLQARAGRSADRLAGEGVGHMRTGLRHAIEVGHQVERIAVQSGTIPALLVGEKNDDVGTRHLSDLRVSR